MISLYPLLKRAISTEIIFQQFYPPPTYPQAPL